MSPTILTQTVRTPISDFQESRYSIFTYVDHFFWQDQAEEILRGGEWDATEGEDELATQQAF